MFAPQSGRRRRRVRVILLLTAGVIIGLAALAIVAARTPTGARLLAQWWPRWQSGGPPYVGPSLTVPRLSFTVDKDGDGITDLDDILVGARKDATNRPVYRSAYYRGGYPPDDEGVCTDVIWRALKEAGYDLKALVDADIAAHTRDYPRVAGAPDPNIDFRRVPNLLVYFKKTATSLTTDVIPGDATNLAEWQGGDIVVFGSGQRYDHIAIVSDTRRHDGVPLLIHNYGTYTREDDMLQTWPTGIGYHFRFPRVPE